MGNEVLKGQRELAVFSDFVRLSSMPIIMDSVRKMLPPRPDLLCQIGEETVAFELVELCDPNIARMLGRSLHPGNEGVWTSDPTGLIVRNKLRKNYDTDYPIELLCFAAGRVITTPDIILPTIRPYLGSFDHVFRRVWLLAEEHVAVVWE